MTTPFYRIAAAPTEQSGWFFTWPTDAGPHEVHGPFCSHLRCVVEQRRLRDLEEAALDTFDEDLEP